MFVDLTFDPLRFTSLKQEHRGSCLPEDLLGLAEYLYSNSGVVDYTVKGFVNENNMPVIEVAVNAQLDLICQRCLGGLQSNVSSKTRLILVKDESNLPEVEDEIEGEDVIVTPQSMSLIHLVEEEVLLALPITSVHDSEQCHRSDLNLDSANKASPFQVLKNLKS
ncbi:YceD family protein [Ferrovum sp. PN-J185]|uniref:YceD family protein n=1 Tax=Ferrovum sp. PN-J185 TaxID=1356306 RepID=UPI001E53E2C2|nr:YceD family protein [Ferrovum sp. PN-J185]MCC6067711.1 YceD family protein [Ferrovum sp. PN-J185]